MSNPNPIPGKQFSKEHQPEIHSNGASIRNGYRRIALADSFEIKNISAHSLAKLVFKKPTFGQVLATTRFLAALNGDQTALTKIEEAVDGKLPDILDNRHSGAIIEAKVEVSKKDSKALHEELYRYFKNHKPQGDAL